VASQRKKKPRNFLDMAAKKLAKTLGATFLPHPVYDSDVSLKLAYHSGFVTRGNKYKLLNHRFHYDI